MRIVIDDPVPGVFHSLQSKDGHPLDPKRSTGGEPLSFEFPIRFAEGPKFFGDQVRREGPERRFVYIRIGQSAGDCASPWSRRMNIRHSRHFGRLAREGGGWGRRRDKGRRDGEGWVAGLRYRSPDGQAGRLGGA